jgi:hypothetical protein
MAAITSAVVAAGAAAYSANRQSKAAKAAANATTQAAQDSNQMQWQMYQQNRDDLQPWRQAGQTGLNEYMALLGLPQAGAAPAASSAPQITAEEWYLRQNPDVKHHPGYGRDPRAHYERFGLAEGRSWGVPQAGGNTPAAPASNKTPQQLQQDAFAKFRANPGYQFGLDEGRNQVEASAAARGGLNSGATLKALTRFGRDYADQQGFAPHMNRLASLAGIGQTATAQTGDWGQNYAARAGHNLINAGNQRAQSTYARADAQSNMAGNLAGIAGMVGSYYANRPQTAGYTAPSQSWAAGFGNNTGWLSGGWGG